MNDKIEGLCQWLKETKGITKIDVIELAKYMPEYEEYLESQKKEWLTGKVKCDLCGHEWIAVYHFESDRLECPRCSNIAMFDVID